MVEAEREPAGYTTGIHIDGGRIVYLNHIRLGLAALWGVTAVALLGRAWLFPADAFDRFDPAFLNTGGTLAAVLTAYNLLRWYLDFRKGGRRRPAPVNPLAVKRVEPPSDGANPELDVERKG